jgi:hypothetical protein
MKAVSFCCLMALLCLNATSQIKKSDFQGAWKLIVAQEIDNGIIRNAFSSQATFSETKIWSGNHVMFVSHYKGKKEENDDYGSGTWKLNGNNYEESYTISSYKESLENKTVRIKLALKGDTLVQTFFLNEKFEPDADTLYVWKYLKYN